MALPSELGDVTCHPEGRKGMQAEMQKEWRFGGGFVEADLKKQNPDVQCLSHFYLQM